MAEIKWSCGCYEMDGKLEAECTSVRPHGELRAHELGKPYSAQCARLANKPEAPKPVTKNRPKADEDSGSSLR